MVESKVREILTGNSNLELESRIPVAPIVDTRYLASLQGKKTRALYGEDFLWPGGKENSRAQLEGLRIHNYDIVLVGSQVKYGRRKVIEKEDKNWKLEDEYGGVSVAPPDDTPRSKDPAVSNNEDLNQLTPPNFDDGRLDHIESISEDIGNRAFVLGGVPESPFSFAAYLRGARNFMVDLRKNRKFINELLEFTTKTSLKLIDSLAQHATDGIWIGDGLASGSLISPETYKEWALPNLRQIVDRAHEYDIPVFYHVCGKTNELIEPITDSGVDVFEVDSPENSGLTLPEALEKTSNSNLVIKGNLDPLLIANGAEEKVRETTRERLEQGGNSGRFILSSGCFLPGETPQGNVQAMIEEGRNYSNT